MDYTHPGRLYVERFGRPEEREHVLGYARFLRSEAGLDSEPPVDLTPIYSRFGIPLPTRRKLPGLQGLLANHEWGLIVVNEDDLPVRQRFTEAHELIELLFSVLPAGQGWAARRRAGVFKITAKERLCNEAAAELLMPRDTLLPRIARRGVTFATARRLAAEYQVSLTAAVVQMARVGPGRHAVVLWRMKNKPSDLKGMAPPNQLRLFPDYLPQPPSKKLRVEWSLMGPGVSLVPRHKSVPEETSIHLAWATGKCTSGEDHLELGRNKGLHHCENWPFDAGGEKQVLSLLHMPGDSEGGAAAGRFALWTPTQE